MIRTGTQTITMFVGGAGSEQRPTGMQIRSKGKEIHQVNKKGLLVSLNHSATRYQFPGRVSQTLLIDSSAAGRYLLPMYFDSALWMGNEGWPVRHQGEVPE